jgi:hypothetical protein
MPFAARFPRRSRGSGAYEMLDDMTDGEAYEAPAFATFASSHTGSTSRPPHFAHRGRVDPPPAAAMIDAAAQAYIDAIPPERRPLFDRVHRLILEAHPDADVVLSYKMPTYVVGDNRLYVGAWKHWVSFYGWESDRDGGFAGRHPDLTNGKGTLKALGRRPNTGRRAPGDGASRPRFLNQQCQAGTRVGPPQATRDCPPDRLTQIADNPTQLDA